MNSKSYIYEGENMKPNITNRDVFKYSDLGNISKSVGKSYVFDNNGTKPEFTNRDMFKNKEIYRSASASSQYKPTTRENVGNMTIDPRKEDLNISYKKPETNTQEYAQLIPEQHLKEDKNDLTRFNPPSIPPTSSLL